MSNQHFWALGIGYLLVIGAWALGLLGVARERQRGAAVKALITAGPTHEPIDPVRYIGNRSSGQMGVAVATEAFDRGADVTLVLGPGAGGPPRALRVVRVQTAEEKRAATLEAP